MYRMALFQGEPIFDVVQQKLSISHLKSSLMVR
jgi:hypothetical protein